MFMMSSVLISTQCSHSARLEKLHETVINNVHMKKMTSNTSFTAAGAHSRNTLLLVV